VGKVLGKKAALLDPDASIPRIEWLGTIQQTAKDLMKAQERNLSDNYREILQILTDKGPQHYSFLADEMDKPPQQIKNTLSRMKGRKLVQQVPGKPGWWERAIQPHIHVYPFKSGEGGTTPTDQELDTSTLLGEEGEKKYRGTEVSRYRPTTTTTTPTVETGSVLNSDASLDIDEFKARKIAEVLSEENERSEIDLDDPQHS
jgi:hypothetical protein